MASSLPKPEHRRATNDRSHGDDSWVDPIADDVSALLRESGLQMELVVFYDWITETLHAVGYDGSAARYFRSLEADGTPSGSHAARGNPMSENISQPAQDRRATTEEASQ
jgi:hypothetical protein